MFGPKNIRCRNFNDEGVGVCDSGEYCRFVHPGPRWANARPCNNRDELEHIPKFWASGGGGGGSRGRPGGGGGGGRGPIPRRCRHFNSDGTPVRGGCFRHSKGECKFTHPDQPGWDTATPSENSTSHARTSFGLTSGPNSLGRGVSTSSFGRTSTDATFDATSGSGFGTNETQQSPELAATSYGWGQSNSNEPEQPANETSGGGGWGGGDTSHGWGAGETSNTNSGWGGGGGWGSSGDVSGSGGGGWGSSSKIDNTTDTAQPTTQKDSADTDPSIQTSSNTAWGSANNTWGSSNNTWGSSNTWDSSNDAQDSSNNVRDSSNNAWGSSSNARDSSNNAWGSSNNTWGSSDNTWDSSKNAQDSSNNARDSSNNAWGSSDNVWGSSNNAWGSSNNTWAIPNETAQNEPASDAGPDKTKGKGWDSGVQNSSRSSWRDTSTSETTAGLGSSRGGWGNSTPSVPATVGVTQDYAHATARLENSSTTMEVDEGEPQFEGKAIFNALENVVHRRRKRKRSHEDITQSPRYYRHLLAYKRTTESVVDGDGDAMMGGTTNRSTPMGFLEPGEIIEAPPCSDYDVKVLSREPKTSEEKTTFAKNLLYIFTEAAVMVDRSSRAEKRYEDYKKSQEARIYSHPGPDARNKLVEKLQALRASSHEQSERLARIVADLGSLPSCFLSDVVAYNEHNHLTEDVLAEGKRKAAIDEVEKRLNEQHDCVDQKLLDLRARLDELAKEKETRETARNLPPLVDPHEVAVEEAVIVHQANIQRVATVEVSIQTITSAESIPHKDGPIEALEKLLPTMDGQAPELQEFAESIAKLIQQVPVIRREIDVIKASNEEHKAAEKAANLGVLNQQVATSSAQLEALNARVTEVFKSLQPQVTMENIQSAIRPVLAEQTRFVIADVHECVDRGLDLMRGLIQEERSQMQSHIYQRLVGTQRLFEAVGCYLRSVRADLASLVDKDRGTTEPS